MRTIVRLLAVVMMMATAVAVGSAAQAYPDPAPTIEIDPHACAGDPVPFWAQASVSGDWTVTYKDAVRTANGPRIDGTLPSEPSDAGVAHRFTATVVTADGQTLSASTDVVLAECGTSTPAPADPNNEALPRTGSNFTIWWAVLAVTLIVVGDTLVRRRRRHR